eukprot:14009399-Alexandrium_andersonii.AAC.1
MEQEQREALQSLQAQVDLLRQEQRAPKVPRPARPKGRSVVLKGRRKKGSATGSAQATYAGH